MPTIDRMTDASGTVGVSFRNLLTEEAHVPVRPPVHAGVKGSDRA